MLCFVCCMCIGIIHVYQLFLKQLNQECVWYEARIDFGIRSLLVFYQSVLYMRLIYLRILLLFPCIQNKCFLLVEICMEVTFSIGQSIESVKWLPETMIVTAFSAVCIKLPPTLSDSLNFEGFAHLESSRCLTFMCYHKKKLTG